MQRRRSDAPANRLQLIEAARRVFAEKGISAEVKDIAAEAGVGIGTFYRNFPRKDDLILALLEEVDEFMEAAFEQAAQGDRKGVERIRFVILRFFETEQRYGWLAEALWSGQLPKEWLVRDRDDQKRELLEQFLQQGVDEGDLRKDFNAPLAIAMMMGAIVFRSRLNLDLGPEETADTVLQLMLQGIGQR